MFTFSFNCGQCQRGGALKNLHWLKIKCQRRLTRCGFGSNAQPTQGIYGSEVPYHSCCLPYRVGFWVGPLGYSGPFSFWGSFWAIFNHFSNGPSANNFWNMAQGQNHKSKPTSWTIQKRKKILNFYGQIFGQGHFPVFFLTPKMTPRVDLFSKKILAM